MKTPLAPLVPLAFFCATGLFAARAEARLSGDVVPDRYAIKLAPELEAGRFSGEETIDVRVLRPTAAIVLNAVDLEIADARVTVAGEVQSAHVRLDPKSETATLLLAHPLAPGLAHIALSFRGRLDDKLRGFYRARSAGRLFALTQFESTDARRAFPCFDEPAYKARFRMTLVAPLGLVAITNSGPVRSQRDEAKKTETWEFRETLPMSTYLVAVAIGPFEARGTRLERNGGALPIVAYAATGNAHLAGYGLAAAADVIPRLEAYFGVPYPYDQLSLIAAPEFQFGGMENVAAIIFKEAALLVDDKTASPAAKRHVVEVVAHEVAHQWFGDLVTMAWWDDVWLNESFATWMEKKVVAAAHPAWRIGRDFSVERGETLRVDELADAHPIRPAESTTAEEPETSPAIVYGKGAAVLRMLERYLGDEAFQKGVAAYIRAHQFGSTRAADLWTALEAASEKPVPKLAEAWVGKAGHPLVSLTVACEGGHSRVTLEQKRIHAGAPPSTSDRAEAPWPVPICMRYGPPDAAGTSPVSAPAKERCILLETKSATVKLDGGCAAWVYGNAGSAGFYRVLHDDKNLAALRRAAPLALAPEERVALLDDQLALAAAGRAPLGAYLDLAAAMSIGRGPGEERDAAVLDEIRGALDRFDRDLVGDADRPRFVRFVESLYGPILASLGERVRPGDDEETKRIRAGAFEALGLLARRPDVLASAAASFVSFQHDPGALDASLKNAVVAVAAASGDAGLYDQLLARFRAPGTPEDRDRTLEALGRFTQPALVERSLALSLSDTVRVEEMDRPIRDALSQRRGRGAAFRYLAQHVGELARRASPYGMIRLVNGTAKLCGSDEARAVRALFLAHPIERGRLAVALAAESAEECGALRERGSAALAKWLQERFPNPGE